VRASLQLADAHDLRSVALPAISTGIFGYPRRDAAVVMLQAAISYLRGETGLERVVFCLYGQPTLDVFVETLAALLPDPLP
jgi:O-acetyl-ADP-ribose deacetylase (regulator of RNase III)